VANTAACGAGSGTREPTVADDALTEAEREALESVMRSLATYASVIKAQARAEGARDALNAAADDVTGEHLDTAWQIAAWLRERSSTTPVKSVRQR
jgi:hypothetical protein